MSVTRLQVTYKSSEVDEELDKKILKFFGTLNFVCIDQVYHSIIFRRDIFFETQGEIKANKKLKEALGIKDESKRNQEVKLKA